MRHLPPRPRWAPSGRSPAHLALAWFLPVLTLLWVLTHPNLTRADTHSLGKKIDDFTLRDVQGQPRSLNDWTAPAVVVVFLGAECPLAKLYAPRLEALQQRFRDRGVVFVAINSNAQDSLTEVAAHARRHGITFPVLKDLDGRVAERFGATRTPEAFVLDRQRIVRYQGRVDDQYGVGRQRPQAQREDVAVALEQLLRGESIQVAFTAAVGCHIGRARRTEPRGEITYHKHVAPIVNARCVECHRDGQIAPFPLTRFEHFQGWDATIAEVVRENRMPPWSANPEFGHFRNDARLADDERRTLLAWIENGLPEGDPRDAPPVPQFVQGWRMPEPDRVIHMRATPYDVPAEGVIDYQYFEVDPGFTEDTYVWAAEARPDNRAVVHHIIVYIQPPGERDFRKLGAIDGYAPGSEPKVYRDGLARLVPARSKLVFEMHYTANGSPQRDRSCIGLKFLEPSQVKKTVYGSYAANAKFVIPPRASAHPVRAERSLERDALLLSLTPHMHVRGRSFRFAADYPDGRREVLLDVPRYDFNWQLTYELQTPQRLPKGTRIVCEATYDNSEANPANPDPAREVRWGDQSWEEMMIGFFDVVAAE